MGVGGTMDRRQHTSASAACGALTQRRPGPSAGLARHQRPRFANVLSSSRRSRDSSSSR